MIHELRVYHALPGRLPLLLARFRDHTIDQVGNWPVFAGLGFVLAGLYTATKWH